MCVFHFLVWIFGSSNVNKDILGSASQSTLNVDSQYNYHRSIYGDSDAGIPFMGS